MSQSLQNSRHAAVSQDAPTPYDGSVALSTRTLAPPLATTASWLRTIGLYGLEMAVFMVFFSAYFLLRGAAPLDIPLATDKDDFFG